MSSSSNSRTTVSSTGCKFLHLNRVLRPSLTEFSLPGVPPTHLKAAIPFTAVVNIRGDRLYHEHISWDQGTALRQLSLLPEYLPFPHPLPADNDLPEGVKAEYRVPVLGVETADKLRNRKAVPSNGMFEYAIREKKD
jgi:carboxymethylenebutenolidase